MSNSFGRIFTFTSFGESHGEYIGGVIDGCPSNIEIDMDFIQKELYRRKPGKNQLTSLRNESDKVEFLSGIYEGKSTGTPIAFLIKNEDAKNEDYKQMRDIYRPSHADYTYEIKYGIRDYRGGGRSSARETACRVVAGAIAKLILKSLNIKITAYTSQIGHIRIDNSEKINLNSIDSNPLSCPQKDTAEKMLVYLQTIKKEGDSIGGIVSCIIEGVPIGLGEPVYDKLSARLAYAMLSIPAAHGFEYGAGFEAVSLRGSELNDSLTTESNRIKTVSNYSGGIQGGISNGENIFFRVLFKPIPTIQKKQKTINKAGDIIEFEGKGRHDPCVIPRVIPVVEAMAALTLVDFYLMDMKNKRTT